MIRTLVLLTFVFVMGSAMGMASESTAQPRPVLLDVDPGIDDALAILLALRSPEIDVVGISVVAGNVEVDVGARNARQVLELAGRSDVPVARGAAAPLLGKLVTSKHVHGENGLGNITLPPPSMPVDERSAVDFIAAKAREHAGRLTLIPVGPLTNVALALKLHPGLASQIQQIVLMGGSISGGNITAAAEFNIFNDPEAAEVVFQSGVAIVMVGLDVTMKTVLTPQDLEAASRTSDPVTELVKGLTDFHLKTRRDRGIVLHDPLAVGVAIDPTFVETERGYVEVETRGEKTRGQTLLDRRGYALRFEEGPDTRRAVPIERPKPNADVCREVDAERFIRFFVDRVASRTPAR